jgi:competence ComEA-like helix-hairpin-helix protein
MTAPRGAQRVLFALAAALLALGAWAGGSASRRPLTVAVADDPALDVRIDLNRSSASDLESLPGVGAALAARIAAHRTAHGPFRSVEELGLVAGVGEALIGRLRPLVKVD